MAQFFKIFSQNIKPKDETLRLGSIKTKAKEKKAMKKMVLGIILSVMSMWLLSGCGSSKSVDLTDYVTVNYSGSDGQGTAAIDYDLTQLELDLIGKEEGEVSTEDLEGFTEIVPFEMSIKWELDKSEGLSNGDKVTVTVSYDSDAAKEQNIKVEGDCTKEFEVSGLKEPIELDAFDSSIFDVEAGEKGVVVQLDGTSPNIMIYISNSIDSDNPLSKVDYSIEGDEQELGTYKNGDEITIVATLPKDLATEGYVLKEEKKTITVGGVNEYISSMDELTDADWEVINSKIEEFKAANLSGGTYSGLSIVTDSGKQTIQGFSDVNFDKAYMINAKVNEMDNFWGEEAHNKLSVRFKMNVNKIYKEMVGEESVSEDVYGMIHTTNLKRSPDGSLEIGDFYMYEDCYSSESAFEEAVINEKANDFTISEKALN